MENPQQPHPPTDSTTKGIVVPVILAVVLGVAALIGVLALGGGDQEAPTPVADAPGAAARPALASDALDQKADQKADQPTTAADTLAEQVQANGLFRGPKQKVSDETRQAGEHRAKLTADPADAQGE